VPNSSPTPKCHLFSRPWGPKSSPALILIARLLGCRHRCQAPQQRSASSRRTSAAARAVAHLGHHRLTLRHRRPPADGSSQRSVSRPTTQAGGIVCYQGLITSTTTTGVSIQMIIQICTGAISAICRRFVPNFRWIVSLSLNFTPNALAGW
jgi:hypothetical protein